MLMTIVDQRAMSMLLPIIIIALVAMSTEVGVLLGPVLLQPVPLEPSLELVPTLPSLEAELTVLVALRRRVRLPWMQVIQRRIIIIKTP